MIDVVVIFSDLAITNVVVSYSVISSITVVAWKYIPWPRKHATVIVVDSVWLKYVIVTVGVTIVEI